MPSKHDVSWTHSEELFGGPGEEVPSIRSLGAADLNVVFQPIVSLANGSTFAHEALVRCKHKALGNPGILFKQAVDQRACGHLGRAIRNVAFDRVSDSALFVNIHPDELSSRWLVRPDDAMGFHGGEVFLEITETAAFTHFDLCMNVLREVCERTGAHLVVDDFGAGHSNIQRVLDLRPAIVKLDGALIQGLDGDRRRQKLVTHLVELCADLGAKIVAECVETVEELKAVRDTGAHFVQGFLLAKPAYPLPDVAWPLRSTRHPVAITPNREPKSRRSVKPASKRSAGDSDLPEVRAPKSRRPGRGRRPSKG